MSAEHAADTTEPSTAPNSCATAVEVPMSAEQQQQNVPNHVAIIAMGSSCAAYAQLSAARGGWFGVADEIWAINATAGIFKHHRAFVMDDVKHTITREAEEGAKTAQGILKWLPHSKVPVYSSKAYPEWPALVEYPLRDVLQSIGGLDYLNTSVAHAVAFAIHLGVKEISLYGCDFTYPDLHASESGRGCVEYWLGVATSKGIRIGLPGTTTLMDAQVPDGKRIYGYHEPVYARVVDGQVEVSHGTPFPTSTEAPCS